MVFYGHIAIDIELILERGREKFSMNEIPFLRNKSKYKHVPFQKTFFFDNYKQINVTTVLTTSHIIGHTHVYITGYIQV